MYPGEHSVEPARTRIVKILPYVLTIVTLLWLHTNVVGRHGRESLFGWRSVVNVCFEAGQFLAPGFAPLIAWRCAKKKALGRIADRDFLCLRDLHSSWCWDGSLAGRINAGSHMEALPGATPVAHALPHVARSWIPGTCDCHDIGQHRLLSPPHLGLVAGCHHFRYQWTERCWTDSHRPFFGGCY
jgi:hypothetical protein